MDGDGLSNGAPSVAATKQPKLVVAAKNDTELARARKDKKAFYTLGYIVSVFLICWIPFYLYIMVTRRRDLFSSNLTKQLVYEISTCAFRFKFRFRLKHFDPFL